MGNKTATTCSIVLIFERLILVCDETEKFYSGARDH